MATTTGRHERRHRCFCGMCKSTTGAILIAGFELTLAIYFLASALIIRERTLQRYGAILATIYFVFAGSIFVVVAFLFLGIFTNRRSLLLVHLLKDVIFFGALFIITILAIVEAAKYGVGALLIKARDEGDPRNREVTDALTTATGYIIFSFLLAIAYTGMQIWFFIVVLAAYKCMGNRVGGVRKTKDRNPNVTWSRLNILKYGYSPSTGFRRSPQSIRLSMVRLENCDTAKESSPTKE